MEVATCSVEKRKKKKTNKTYKRNNIVEFSFFTIKKITESEVVLRAFPEKASDSFFSSVVKIA